MQRLDDAAYGELAKVLRERMAALAPDWRDDNQSDPGVTLIELFAFLTESLLYRQNLIPERGRSSAARLAKFARMLADAISPTSDGALARVRYYPGQILTADDFGLEQDYVRERLRRVNRALHGSGVVRGLGVSVQLDNSGTGQQVLVEPGFAIDARGEEIEVCGPVTASLPPTGHLLYVTLHHVERATRLQPAPGGDEFSRIEEGSAVLAEVAAADDAVVLARLLGEAGRWRGDDAFRPTRVGRERGDPGQFTRPRRPHRRGGMAKAGHVRAV